MTTTNVMESQVPATSPAPANFRVTWEQPDDADLFWTFVRMHCPEPITPMAGEFIGFFEEGSNRATEACAMPTRVRARRINTYY